MNINYQFSDIIGTTYKNGPIHFMPDGYSIICPNGNRLKWIDIKRNISNTSKVQLQFNIRTFAINYAGTLALIADTKGRCALVNLQNDLILHNFNTNEKIKAIRFSPDSSFVAIGVGGSVKIYSIASSYRQQFNPFKLTNTIKHSAEEPVNSLDWSFDGRLIAAGGESRVVKIFAAQKGTLTNVGIFAFAERAPLIGVWFMTDNDYGLICVDRSGKASFWECSMRPDELIPVTIAPNKQSEERQRLSFTRKKRINLNQSVGTAVQITATSINKSKKLLVCAFANGIFCIFELVEFELLQNFRAGEQRINGLDINSSGDWLAIGCGHGNESQFLVWEWKSESYIQRQQSHSETITTTAYSPNGSILATGAEDGKVKLWDCNTSLCLVTFTEHQTGVTDVCFTQSGRAILSASLEGAIRAHDLKRYRNFRTMVVPKQTQLNFLCADSSGDIVMASSRDQFEIYIWALETGQLLEVLTGHADLISGLATFENSLCSVALDKTLKFWNILEGNCIETVQLLNEGLDVEYSPTGSLLAVLCYDSNINLFDVRNTKQIGTIETKLDIDAGRQQLDKVKKTTSEKNKSFTCIAFSPNGQFLLAGGQSNSFCLYSVADRIRVRTFKLSANLNLDGINLDIDYRKATEFGNLDLFDLTDSDEEGINSDKRIKLPGTRHTNLSERALKPTVLVTKIAFSPTGQDFAVVSTEGVHIFTRNQIRRFDPFKLELNVTPKEVHHFCHSGEYSKALILAMRLNNSQLIRHVVESIPMEQVRMVVSSLGFVYAERLLAWIGTANKSDGSTPNRHFHFYLLLSKELLYAFGADFKRSLEQNKPAITAIQQQIATQQKILMDLNAQNKHSLEYILMARTMAQMNCKNPSKN